MNAKIQNIACVTSAEFIMAGIYATLKKYKDIIASLDTLKKDKNELIKVKIK